MTPPLLFLDIDGVLNSSRFFHAHPNRQWSGRDEPIDPSAIVLLQRLVDETRCEVVVSSSWRYMYSLDRLREMFERHQLRARIRGVTPIFNDERGQEIAAYLATEPSGLPFVIFDDCTVGEPVEHRLVRTHYHDGLTDYDVERALAMLRST